MAGIIFFTTRDLATIKDFYLNEVGAKAWLSQPNIEILAHGNFIFGFHLQNSVSKDVMLTFFYRTNDEVDVMYQRLKNVATSPPKVSTKYNIYHFFAKDPEGRNIEFQHFLHKVPPIEGVNFTE